MKVHRFFIPLMTLCICIILSACVGPRQITSAGNGLSPQYAELKSKYQKMASRAEKRGELYNAALYWWVLANLEREAFQARDRSEYLLRLSHQKAEEYYEIAADALEHKDNNKAKQNVLKALLFNPKHKKALQLLSNMQNKGFSTYKISENDTLYRIVMKEYRNPEMVPIIANYNDIAENKKLKRGKEIKLIIDDGPYEFEKTQEKYKAITNYKEIDSFFTNDVLTRAVKSFQDKNFKRTISLTAMILKENQTHEEAKKLHDQSIYQQAIRLMKRGDYLNSMSFLEQLDSNYSDVAVRKKDILNKMKELAETHYRNGVKSFLAEDLSAAKQEWEAALRYDPNHNKAQNGLQKVNKQLKRLEALE